jgi:hypothetical protein
MYVLLQLNTKKVIKKMMTKEKYSLKKMMEEVKSMDCQHEKGFMVPLDVVNKIIGGEVIVEKIDSIFYFRERGKSEPYWAVEEAVDDNGIFIGHIHHHWN